MCACSRLSADFRKPEHTSCVVRGSWQRCGDRYAGCVARQGGSGRGVSEDLQRCRDRRSPLLRQRCRGRAAWRAWRLVQVRGPERMRTREIGFCKVLCRHPLGMWFCEDARTLSRCCQQQRCQQERYRRRERVRASKQNHTLKGYLHITFPEAYLRANHSISSAQRATRSSVRASSSSRATASIGGSRCSTSARRHAVPTARLAVMWQRTVRVALQRTLVRQVIDSHLVHTSISDVH